MDVMVGPVNGQTELDMDRLMDERKDKQMMEKRRLERNDSSE